MSTRMHGVLVDLDPDGRQWMMCVCPIGEDHEPARIIEIVTLEEDPDDDG